VFFRNAYVVFEETAYAVFSENAMSVDDKLMVVPIL
jgi:hypothetical protein